MLINSSDGNSVSEDHLDKTATSLAEFDLPDEEMRETDSLLAKLLDIRNSNENDSYRSFCWQILVLQLSYLLYRCVVDSVFRVTKRLLHDTGVPKSIHSTDLLGKAL